MISSVIKPYEVFPHATLPCIVMKWRGNPTSKDFREGTEKMLDLLKLKKFTKVISDVKQMELITADDQEWVLNEFLPKALKEGFRVMAFINSDEYLTNLIVENMAYRIKLENMNFGFFDNYQTAEEWIKTTEYFPPSFDVTYNREANCVILQWFGMIKGAEFQEGLKAMLSLLEEKKSSRAIINLEAIPYSVDLETNEWIKESFLPLAISRGSNKYAFINPGIYNTLSIYNIAYSQKPKLIEVEILGNMDEAIKWISNDNSKL